MKSVQELNILRDTAGEKMNSFAAGIQWKVVIGMATCGRAAGAQNVLDAMVDELELRAVKNVEIKKTGCIGICKYEPIIEVYDKDNNRTTYVSLDEKKARRIVLEHFINGKVCYDLTIGSVMDSGNTDK